MTRQEIIDKYYQNKTKYIYGYMYGAPTISFAHGETIPDKLIKIEKSKLIMSSNEDKLVFIWGYPGPDYTTYNIDDYGWSWAYTVEEITGGAGN